MAQFTTIDHEIRRKFNITLNEYAVCDSIYYLSRYEPCNASKEYIGEFIGISRQTVQKIINNLIYKKLIIKVKFGHLMTSEIWENEILQTKTVKKVDTNCKESLQLTVKKVDTNCKESLHNIYNIDTINNNSIHNNKKFIIPTLEQIKNYIIINDYNVDPVYFYKYFTEGNWIDSEGKKVKNWKQKIITWNNSSKKQLPKQSEYVPKPKLINGKFYDKDGNEVNI
jgi:hypothetical protein